MYQLLSKNKAIRFSTEREETLEHTEEIYNAWLNHKGTLFYSIVDASEVDLNSPTENLLTFMINKTIQFAAQGHGLRRKQVGTLYLNRKVENHV